MRWVGMSVRIAAWQAHNIRLLARSSDRLAASRDCCMHQLHPPAGRPLNNGGRDRRRSRHSARTGAPSSLLFS